MERSPVQLTDDALLAEVKRLARCERETVATLVAHLVEVERRDLHRAEGCSSMFTYCTEVLRYSEDAAAVRLQAARAARLHPQILEDLASGALHLSALRLLVPHLTMANGEELFAASRHKSKREVEALVRERFPLPDVPATVRKLQSPAITLAIPNMVVPGNSPNAERTGVAEVANAAVPAAVAQSTRERTSVIVPLAADRYKVQFTGSAELHGMLRRAQDLLRHRVPSGDLAQVFELALTALVEKLEKQKFAATDRPRTGPGVASGSRTIPAEVKRVVWERDGGRCAFISKNDWRCSETGFLEFHHVVPYATGGAATVANIALRCRSHNQYEAKLEFGAFVAPVVRESSAAWGHGRAGVERGGVSRGAISPGECRRG